MKNFKLSLFILFTIPLCSVAKTIERDTIRIFYLGGQSNMDGYGYNADLPDSLDKTFKDVWIFHGNTAHDGENNGGIGIWDNLQPGHGRYFSSDGKKNKLSNRFGVELSLAHKLQALYPNEKIALLKYSKGGTSIDSVAAGNFGCWEPDFRSKSGINQYDHFLKTINGAFATKDIDGDGKEDVLVPCGIVWMQGESDAQDEEVALRYYDNLKRLMDLMRAAFRTDDLPVVIGKISDSWNSDQGKVWKYGELVQYAQEKYILTEDNAAIVRDTRYYKYSDRWHYNSNGYIDLGEKFAEALYRLNP
ncbi:MAG: hypothetical protein PF444_03750 [Bacteroidales bacterium]|jgi:hypothetical protein|nr:hypothetical protein [Bacteroidales bacterium]